jgi:hypothetical protein
MTHYRKFEILELDKYIFLAHWAEIKRFLNPFHNNYTKIKPVLMVFVFNQPTYWFM